MEKGCLSDRFAALCFTHTSPDGPAAARALDRALTLDGREPWPDAEIELFSRRGCTLLIARPRSARSGGQNTTK